MSVLEIVVGRQAIFDRGMQVVAYELLFRAQATSVLAESELTGTLMTANVLFSSLNLGIQGLAGDKLMFCNADHDVLTGSIPIVLPPEQTVVEILETVVPDAEVIAGCLRLMNRGYQLALDDFVWFDGVEQLLELVSIVKIDLLAYDEAGLREVVRRCRDFGVHLLAEKIETQEQLDLCLELEFEYFQGYYLQRPRTVSGRTLTGSQLGAARVANSLLSREFEVDEIEEILRTEPGLTYQLIQLAGAGAGHGFRRKIRSVRDALVMVGPSRTQSWLALLMLRQYGRPSEHHLTIALTRAKMCELLAMTVAPRLGPLAFTAGVLSAFDLLMGVDTAEVTAAMNLDEELHEAAFGCSSPVARIVRDVIDYQAAPTTAPRRSDLSDLDFDSVAGRSLTWAVESISTIAA